MNLSTARANLTVGVALMVVIVLAGWFLLVGPTVSAVGETRTQGGDVADANLVLTTQLGTLRAQAEDLTVTRAAATELEALWPATADQPGFFRAVNAAASAAGYADGDITALSPGAPVAVVAGTDVAALAAGTAPATPAPAEAAPDGEAAPADGTVAPAAAPTYAVQTLTLTVEGSYDQARELFLTVAVADDFADFLTVPAYETMP